MYRSGGFLATYTLRGDKLLHPAQMIELDRRHGVSQKPKQTVPMYLLRAAIQNFHSVVADRPQSIDLDRLRDGYCRARASLHHTV